MTSQFHVDDDSKGAKFRINKQIQTDTAENNTLVLYLQARNSSVYFMF